MDGLEIGYKKVCVYIKASSKFTGRLYKTFICFAVRANSESDSMVIVLTLHNHAQAKRTADGALRRHSVASTGQNCQKITNLAIF